MEFLDDIKKKLSEEEFSFEVLNDCRIHFQYGGFDENDKLEFKRLLTLNINKYYPNITKLQIDQIARVCIDRGVLETKNILFLDGTAFTIKTDEIFSPGVKYIDYVWESNDYECCDFLDVTFFFRNERLKKQSQYFLSKLRDELNELFVEYYNITSFPEALGLNYAVGQTFAIKYNEEEVINGLNNDVPFSISIICRVLGTTKIRLLNLTYNPNGKRLILINKVDDNFVKLSDLLKEKNKEEANDRSISDSEKFMDSFINDLNNGKLKKDICAQPGKVFMGSNDEIKSELESYQSLLKSGIIRQELKDEQGPILKKTRK